MSLEDCDFEWDENKRVLNLKKHGVCFTESMSCWTDSFSLEYSDQFYLIDEERFIKIGVSYKGRLLVTVFCWSREPDLIRIISSRKGTKKEKEIYER